MEMPRPTEAHRNLERLTGTWTGVEIMHPSPWDPQGGKADGRTVGRVALGGFSVIVDYEQRKEGTVTFTGHGVYTYDTAGQCIVLYWFDCMGQQPNLFKGNLEGDRMTLTSDESTEGGPRFSRLVYDFTEPGRLTSYMEVSQDRERWERFMEATYTKE